MLISKCLYSMLLCYCVKMDQNCLDPGQVIQFWFSSLHASVFVKVADFSFQFYTLDQYGLLLEVFRFSFLAWVGIRVGVLISRQKLHWEWAFDLQNKTSFSKFSVLVSSLIYQVINTALMHTDTLNFQAIKLFLTLLPILINHIQ